MNEITSDVLIAGASLGGVAAALRAAEMGATVCLLEESDWVGGQLTAQGVCTPDENRWIETTGGTASYRKLRELLREHYTSRYKLSENGKAQPYLNVGSCWVSRIAAEPLAARQILLELLTANPNISIHLNHRIVEAGIRINRVTHLIAEDSLGKQMRFSAPFVLDATELGDLLPLAGVEHVIGAESKAETGERDAPEQAHPEWVQPFTFPFALELRPEGEDHTITPPPDYEELKALQNFHVLDGAMRGMFGELGWWTYRRVIAAENFDDPAFPCDIAMINTGSNDFKGGIVPTEDDAADRETLERARRASLGYVYWLQTECPRVDDPSRRGYPELKLRADLFGTEDGIAPQPYIRESRRIRALKTVLQEEIITAASDGPRARLFEDSCGIGHYWLDIHEGDTPEPSRFMETWPFQIPLGALIPARVTNLLAACKNLGVTHLTNGAYRLHPIEWNVGEAAGALAAFCVERRIEPRTVWEDTAIRRHFQRRIVAEGIPLFWWTDVEQGHPAYEAAHLLGAWGLWPGGDSLEFRPDEPLEKTLRVDALAEAPAGCTRSEAAIWLLSRTI